MPLIFSMKQSSIKTRFTYGFLRTLKRLPKTRATSSSFSPEEISKRCRIIKQATDASMASAVGPRRAWSRALIRRVRWQRRQRLVMRRTRRGERKKGGKEVGGGGQTDSLRKLVPGGETMELCTLLGETAHYIKCLTTQVQVMRNIVDLFSN
ncbi:Transcription factor like [Actinidia chinensis var. chinensis]|uniref:Transcription factor like n=1 Tax=Actinidia chinensis var. chinensis TaxID=1590841 RepID=A0A2R6QJQ1_ACTCC|nr:Transcription factor like [Actinidia chinensis var. chinensis]